MGTLSLSSSAYRMIQTLSKQWRQLDLTVEQGPLISLFDTRAPRRSTNPRQGLVPNSCKLEFMEGTGAPSLSSFVFLDTTRL